MSPNLVSDSIRLIGPALPIELSRSLGIDERLVVHALHALVPQVADAIVGMADSDEGRARLGGMVRWLAGGGGDWHVSMMRNAGAGRMTGAGVDLLGKVIGSASSQALLGRACETAELPFGAIRTLAGVTTLAVLGVLARDQNASDAGDIRKVADNRAMRPADVSAPVAGQREGAPWVATSTWMPPATSLPTAIRPAGTDRRLAHSRRHEPHVTWPRYGGVRPLVWATVLPTLTIAMTGLWLQLSQELDRSRARLASVMQMREWVQIADAEGEPRVRAEAVVVRREASNEHQPVSPEGGDDLAGKPREAAAAAAREAAERARFEALEDAKALAARERADAARAERAAAIEAERARTEARERASALAAKQRTEAEAAAREQAEARERSATGASARHIAAEKTARANQAAPSPVAAPLQKAHQPEPASGRLESDARRRSVELKVCQFTIDAAARSGKLQFDRASAEVAPGSLATLDRLAANIRFCPHARIRIEGHTDSDGSPARNKVLSEQRAISVRNYLVGTGIDARQLLAIGLGATEPLAANSSPRGKAQNRRIEFVVEADAS